MIPEDEHEEILEALEQARGERNELRGSLAKALELLADTRAERDTLAEHARACLESDAVARELADARRLHETERRYLEGLYQEAQGRLARAERVECDPDCVHCAAWRAGRTP